jgi:hypothetical protein
MLSVDRFIGGAGSSGPLWHCEFVDVGDSFPIFVRSWLSSDSHFH